jgi:hypothetical protein
LRFLRLITTDSSIHCSGLQCLSSTVCEKSP